MKAISKYLFLFILMIGVVVYPSFSMAQSVGNPMLTATRTMVTLGVSGEVNHFSNEEVEMESQRGMLKVNLTVFQGVNLFGKWGREDLKFSDSTHGIDGFQFEPEFIYGGGLQWDFFHFSRGNIGLTWQCQALWFNPDGKEKLDSGTESTYLIFEGWELQSGLVVVAGGSRLNFYFGAEGKSYPYQLKMQQIEGQDVYISQWEKKDQVHLGYFLGVDFKLSGNLRTSVEIKNSNLCDFNIMVGISQIGPPP